MVFFPLLETPHMPGPFASFPDSLLFLSVLLWLWSSLIPPYYLFSCFSGTPGKDIFSSVSLSFLLSWNVLKSLPWQSKSLKHLIMIMHLSWPTLCFINFLYWWLSSELLRKMLHSCIGMEKFFFPLHTCNNKEKRMVCCVFTRKHENKTHFTSVLFFLPLYSLLNLTLLENLAMKMF